MSGRPSKEEVLARLVPRAVFAEMENLEIFCAGNPCQAFIKPGTLDHLWVVAGDNASGKSLFCRVVQEKIHQEANEAGCTVEVMRVGMDLRTDSGVLRGMMFGNERRSSTGANSVSTVLAGMRTSQMRGHAHWLMFDEPDIGLSESYSAAMGQMLADFALDRPEHLQALVVVTHSRALARPLVEAGASCVRMGDARSLEDWLKNGESVKTVDDLKSLPEVGHERYLAINAFTRSETPVLR